MECVSAFNDFVKNISLTDEMRQILSSAYKKLKIDLMSDPIGKQIITMFLQGSYARHTGVRPINNDDKLDVDLIVVTKFDSNKMSPIEALNAFKPFLENTYKGKYDFRIQGRSIGIDFKNCKVDLVPTALPTQSMQLLLNEAFSSEEYAEKFYDSQKTIDTIRAYFNRGDEWRSNPLKIPDKEANKWEDTHPLAQIDYAQKRNAEKNGKFLPLVRILKWWKKNDCADIETIKSYPLEHFIGDYCGEGDKVSQLLVSTLENIVSNAPPIKPYLMDRGVHTHDVFQRVTQEDYTKFLARIKKLHELSDDALADQDYVSSMKKWHEIFGDKFPVPDDDGHSEQNSRFTPRTSPSEPTKPTRYA